MELLDPAPVTLLPKGIVVNTKDIYAAVAAHPILPIEKISQIWQVYTTTNKKLKDPTACRLEHFWWHVWGSDRRLLSGEKLARIFEDISTGPTFVPLRSVANRWEGPDMPPVMPTLIRQSNSADDRGEQKPALGNHRQELADHGLRSLSSSASKPPPTHPILKKARGTSSTGPRPTARFLSPQGSPDDDAPKEFEVPSSASTIATKSSLKSTPSPAKKKGQYNKRFVASSANKRRPMLPPRRGSSKDSVTNDASSREAPSSVPASRTPDSQRAISSVTEASTTCAISDSPASLEPPPLLSAKAAGKRPALPRRLTSEKTASKMNGSVSPLLRAAVTPDHTPRETNPALAESLGDLPSPALETRRPNAPARSATVSEATQRSSAEMSRPAAAPPMGRSQSHSGYDRFRTPASPSFPGLFTGATASTTNVAAQGTIIDQSGVGSLPPPSPLYALDDANGPLTSRGSSASLSHHVFTPTQPSTSESFPLARTKSQLTLLLERQKERVGDRSSFKR